MPSKDTLDELLDSLPASFLDPSLAVVDALVFSTLDHEAQSSEGPFDSDGCSRYARIVGTLLGAFSENRHAVQTHPWALRHFIALSIYADELLQLPTVSSSVFDSKVVSANTLRSITAKSQQLATYVLSTGSFMDQGRWHEKVTTASLSPQGDTGLGDLTNFVVDLVRNSARKDTFRESRVLYTVLQHVLSGVSKEDVDHWMVLARKLEKSGEYLFFA